MRGDMMLLLVSATAAKVVQQPMLVNKCFFLRCKAIWSIVNEFTVNGSSIYVINNFIIYIIRILAGNPPVRSIWSCFGSSSESSSEDVVLIR